MSLSADEYAAFLEELKAYKETKETDQFYDREASLVLVSLHRPGEVLTKTCPNCKEKFQTNYKYQGICSRACMKEMLADRGLIWNPERDEDDRWKGEPPSTIKTETLKALYEWAKEVVKAYEDLPEEDVVEEVKPEETKNVFADLFDF